MIFGFLLFFLFFGGILSMETQARKQQVVSSSYFTLEKSGLVDYSSSLGEKWSDASNEEFSDTKMDKETTSSDFSSLGSDNEKDGDLELIQVFAYLRHGVSTNSFFLYNSEYSRYKLVKPSNKEEELTPVGKAQCWSLGRNLALKYGEFLFESIDESSFAINIIKLLKSRICARFVWFGISNYTPFIGIFSDFLVEETMEKRGNCHNCPQETQFPFEDSQLLSEDTDNSEYFSDQLIELHHHKFIDLGDFCRKTGKFFDVDVDPLPLEDVAILKKVSSFFHDTEYMAFLAIQSLSKHLYHGLPLEKGLQHLSQGTIRRALKMKDSWTGTILRSLLNVHKRHWVLPALYGRSLIEDLLSNLQSQETSMNLYVTHDLNIAALLAFLYGARHDIDDFIPYYASTLELAVYYSASKDQKYVKLVFNGDEYTIRDCDAPCELSQFVGLLETYTELGGDLKEFCDA